MLQFLVVAIIIYVSVTWCLRSLQIRRNYGDLFVVVTGCDTGFGRELAYKLDRCGFNVFAACLTKDAASDLDNATSKRLRTAIVDVTKQDAISKLLQIVKNTIPNEKALWGVVNNAGIFGQIAPCDLLSKEHYIQTMSVNLFGMMEVNKQFLPLLRKSKGRIINAASVAGRIGAPSCSPYHVSKFGVEAYSDCLRRELYYQGVSVHIIEPGFFATQIVTSFAKENVVCQGQALFEKTTDELREYYGPDYLKKTFQVCEAEDAYSSYLQYNLEAHCLCYFGLCMGTSVCNINLLLGILLTRNSFRNVYLILSYAVGEALDSQAGPFASKATYKVVNAYFHALTARFPKARYVVGMDANTFARLFWLTPEWFSDFCVVNAGPGKIKPAGLGK